MPNFNHTGPQGMGSRSGRAMGQCMNRGNAAERGMGAADDLAQASEPGFVQDMGQGMGQGNGQGRCCRNGQRQNNRARNRGMNGQQGGMGQGMGQGMGSGMRQGKGMGRGMAPTNQANSCGAGTAEGSDGTGNNS